MEHFYANEWARPWVIANILDSTGFDTDGLIIATMKAREPAGGKASPDKVLPFLYRNAKQNVRELLLNSEDLDVAPYIPSEVNLPFQPEYARTQLIRYDTGYSLYENIGHGDSIREIIDVLRGDRMPKGSPPDRGQSLQ